MSSRWARSLFNWSRSLLRIIGYLPSWSPEQSAAFTSAFVILSAKMAAADGVAVSSETDAFERFLEVPERDKSRIKGLFDQAKKDVTGYEIYADKVGEMLRLDPETKRRVFECLVFIACADGVLHPAEDHFLKTVSSRFGYTDVEFVNIRSVFIEDPESPYSILELPPDATDYQIRKQYRKLAKECHPDKLIANGAPPAVVKAATIKLSHINAAYERIMKQRRLSESKR